MSEPPYPQVTSVVNLKGGVGKTTLCVNLAYGLAFFRDQRVLLIDLDPQANATQYLISQQAYRQVYLKSPPEKLSVRELYEVYDGTFGATKKPLGDPTKFIQRVYEGGDEAYLDLVASKLDLSLVAFAGGYGQLNGQIRWLVDAVASNYDYVLIDCPPTVSRMLIAAFEASHHVLIPTRLDFLSSIGLPLLHKVIASTYPEFARRPADWKPLSLLGIVYTMYDERLTMTRESEQDVVKEAQVMGCPIFNGRMSNSTKFAWSSKNALPIFRTDPRSRYANEIFEITEEFDRKVKASLDP